MKKKQLRNSFYAIFNTTFYLFLYFTVFIIPQRVILAIMGFWVITVSYTIRQSLSFAITEMVVKHHSESNEDTCNVDRDPEDPNKVHMIYI